MSALQGGEIGFRSRSMLVPEYANTAFSLTDPQKVSRIVETEYGFHIIQLIAKQDDQVNSRHILMRPKYWKIKILLPNVLIVSLKQYVQVL